MQILIFATRFYGNWEFSIFTSTKDAVEGWKQPICNSKDFKLLEIEFFFIKAAKNA